MVRMFCAVTLVGSVALIGCEQRSVEPISKTVTSEDVRRDAGQAVNTAAEYSQADQGRIPEESRSPTQGAGRRNRQAPREGSRPEGRRQGQLGSEDGGLGNETGCSPRQAGRGGSRKRGGLEGCPEGSPVGLGRIGQSVPRRVSASSDRYSCYENKL